MLLPGPEPRGFQMWFQQRETSGCQASTIRAGQRRGGGFADPKLLATPTLICQVKDLQKPATHTASRFTGALAGAGKEMPQKRAVWWNSEQAVSASRVWALRLPSLPAPLSVEEVRD